jgi:hypothetical protein
VSETGLGVCYGPSSFPLRDGARVTIPAEDAKSMSCDPGRRRMYRCFVPAIEGCWSPAVHSNCIHNETAALGLRTMGPTPDDPAPWPPAVVKQFKELRIMVKKMNLVPMGEAQVAASYKGALGRRYAEALVMLEDEGLEPRDMKLSAFVKGEKFNPGLKVSKPRMINPRSPKYNLCVASYLKPLEHALWRKWKIGHMCKPTRVSGKGLNATARAMLIERKMANVGDCVVFEVDGKAFEAHVSRAQLELEHGVYRAAYRGDRNLTTLLRAQLHLSGQTSGGVKFYREGCRASGDFNTGLGNTLLMGSFVIAAMRSLDLSHPWTVLADGDNCLLFVHRAVSAFVHHEFFDLVRSMCSHEMTVEKPTTVMEEVVFGQSQPVATVRGYTMVRSPFKVLSGAFCGYRHYNNPQFAPRLALAVAQAERALHRGVPVLGPYFDRAVSILSKYRPLRDPEKHLEGHLIGVKDPGYVPIDAEARLSFELAFGIGVEEQRALERTLESILDAELAPVFDEARWLRTEVDGRHGRDLVLHSGRGPELFEVARQ